MRDNYKVDRLRASRGSNIVTTLLGLAYCVLTFSILAQAPAGGSARLAQYRNLGKAFYENPTTQKQAVEQFRLALGLAPDSAREQVNYGLALLRAGDLQRGIAELEIAQKTGPKVPHTWFNLGVALRKQGKLDEALAQFRGMERLVPDEPVTHYLNGAILKTKGDLDAAVKEFENARQLNPGLAAPHFQLYGLYTPAAPGSLRRRAAHFSGSQETTGGCRDSRRHGMERICGDL